MVYHIMFKSTIMKKIIAMLSLVASFAACSKQEVIGPEVTPEGKQIITARVLNPKTKLAYSENVAGGGSGMSSIWEVGDSFNAIQKTGDDVVVVTFELYSGEGTSSATFKAETEGVTAETVWTAVLGNNAYLGTDELNCSYKGQNGTVEGLYDYNYVLSTGSGMSPEFDFSSGSNLSYIMRLKLPSGIKSIEYTPSAYWKVTPSGATRKYYDTDKYNESDTHTYAAFEPINTSTITLDTPSSSGDIVYIAVPAIDYSESGVVYNAGKQKGNIRCGVVVTILNDTSDNATASNGAVLGADVSSKGGQIATFDMSGWSLIPRPKPSDAILLEDAKAQNITNASLKQKVPASTMKTYWAPFNIGAGSATEVGDYFAFGEVNGGKTDYTFVTYSLRHNPSGEFYNDFISARRYVDGGTTSFLTIAGSRYDAARVKWGIAWRMPHLAECRALWDGNNSYDINATISGVNGMKITNNATSEYVFLPKPDKSKQEYLTGEDSSTFAYIWVADKPQRNQGDTGWNSAFTVGTKKNDLYNDMRLLEYSGIPVRPVLSSSVTNFE